jgi:hypothetical protein
MKVLKQNPPNFAEIDRKFLIKGKPIAFTYGDTVYVPSGHDLVDHVEVHEQIHIEQQSRIPAKEWWEKYIEDPRFRFDQELKAYQAQYQYILEHSARPQRRMLLKKIAHDLSGAMYGYMVDFETAKSMIKGGTGSF